MSAHGAHEKCRRSCSQLGSRAAASLQLRSRFAAKSWAVQKMHHAARSKLVGSNGAQAQSQLHIQLHSSSTNQLHGQLHKQLPSQHKGPRGERRPQLL